MTIRRAYEAILTELVKNDSPELHVDEFNYYWNKGTIQFGNKHYAQFEKTQQISDDVQVLKKRTKITESSLKLIGEQTTTPSGKSVTQALYTTLLPSDYFHLTGCIATYQLQSDYHIFAKDQKVQFPVKRMTDDMEGSILRNAFTKPHYKRPYYSILGNPNQITAGWAATGDAEDNVKVEELINRDADENMVHNSYEDTNADSQLTSADKFTGPQMEIDYGIDSSVFKLVQLDLRYLRYPKYVKITPEQIDNTNDESQVLEFPDYVCREIIKETMSLVLFRNGDPRLQSHAAVETSIPPVTGG